ncbi:DUF4382 domain-containing protein [Halobacterium rubrum]|uniref:DUF4382 domain-containing protein n=1 Tax=Halobacterium TaxID=2239 RepID=UPI001F2B4F4E|nr:MULTISPECIES: DUF4382 domain-containing protein [Halobacterium]MDH5018915.1 DUF4382 domain-containing protein [Halobacterium rubrum]
MNKTVSSLLVAALVVLAGCAGGIAGPEAGGSDASEDGTVQFYVSDERNAIDQFEHLNVTVTSVGFAQADAADANETDTADGNESESETEVEVERESEGGLAVALDGDFAPGENATVEVTQNGEAAANVTAVVEAGDSEVTVVTDANGTATVAVPADADEFEIEAETAENSTYGEASASLSVEAESEDGDSDDDDGNESAVGWVERDVDQRTVDLTELQGANATALGNISVPEGEYEKVFVHVGEVNGTLESGEEVNVKLPSQKLQLNEGFTVDSQSDVAFVFDITVFEAGNSGKYILKPVASESGTDVPIVDVDEKRGGEEADELDVSFVGNVTAGENATVEVTRDGEPVENATVEVTGDVTVTTDADGTATVAVPADAEEFEVEAEHEDGDSESEGELEVDLGESESDDEREEDDGEDGDDSDETDSETPDVEDGDADLAVAYEGAFAANETVTVFVTDGDGEAVEDATVEVDGEVVGETDANGELSVALPADVSMTSELTVTADGESVTVDASTVAAAN